MPPRLDLRALSIAVLASACAPAPPRAPTPLPPVITPTAPAPPAPPSSPAPPPSWSAMRKAARAAYAAKDFPAYRAQLAEMYAISGSAYVLFQRAEADALLGRREEAESGLRAFAAMGLVADVDDDPTFAPFKGDPAMAAIHAQMERNRAPVTRATRLLNLPHDELVTEDVAYDAESRTFLVSSVRQRKIIAVDERGKSRDFVRDGAAGEHVGSICGLAIHGDRLWATTSMLPPMIGYRAADPHPTALLAYDVHTAKPLARIDLAAPGEHALTDLTVAPSGDVFVSDALAGDVYVLRAGKTRLERLTEEGLFVSPQTPAVTPDGRRLLVPDYVRGIAIVDATTGRTTWMPHPADVATNGIDGVYLAGDALFAIQNGTTPVRIVRFTLDPALTEIVHAEVLEQATPGLGEPTHGVVVGDAFVFLANAGWNRFDDDGAIKKGAPADAPAMMRLAIAR